jgi:excisionase family DNA binding protein
MSDIISAMTEHARRIAKSRKTHGAKRRPKEPPPPLRPIAHSIDRAAALIGIGKRTLYGKIKSGELRAVKHDRLTLILDADLVAYVAALPTLDLKTPPKND